VDDLVREPLTIDVDSTNCGVEGHHKQVRRSATRSCWGYRPIPAIRADTGEVLHARMRKGSANTSRDVRQFLGELIARVQGAGATAPITVRAIPGSGPTTRSPR
jgi:hypothetical protein